MVICVSCVRRCCHKACHRGSPNCHLLYCNLYRTFERVCAIFYMFITAIYWGWVWGDLKLSIAGTEGEVRDSHKGGQECLGKSPWFWWLRRCQRERRWCWCQPWCSSWACAQRGSDWERVEHKSTCQFLNNKALKASFQSKTIHSEEEGTICQLIRLNTSIILITQSDNLWGRWRTIEDSRRGWTQARGQCQGTCGGFT